MLHDTDKIKQKFGDLRAYIEAEIGKPVSRNQHGPWTFKCPLHEEKNGAALVVWEDHWKCFGKCATGGDLIEWVQKRKRLDFNQACDFLGSKPSLQINHLIGGHPKKLALNAPRPSRELYAAPDAQWQQKVGHIVQDGRKLLWSDDGKRARDWLMGKRGLSADVIKEASLGYHPGDAGKGETIEGLFIHYGIYIPNVCLGNIWSLKIRTAHPNKENRYRGVTNNKLLGALYWGDKIREGVPVMFIEGEFDVHSVWMAASDLITPLGLLSSTNRVVGKWIDRLLFVPAIYAGMDDDEAGQKANQRLGELGDRVQSVADMRGHKDPNEMLVKDGVKGVRDWVLETIGQASRKTITVTRTVQTPAPPRQITPLPVVAGYLAARNPVVVLSGETVTPEVKRWEQIHNTYQETCEHIRRHHKRRYLVRLYSMRLQKKSLEDENLLYRRFTSGLMVALKASGQAQHSAHLEILKFSGHKYKGKYIA